MKFPRKLVLPLGSIIAIMMMGFTCQTSESGSLPKSTADYVSQVPFEADIYRSILERFSSEPHPFGSAAQLRAAALIEEELKKQSIPMKRQSFVAKVPNPVLLKNPNAPASLTIDIQGANLIADVGSDKPCVILFGSHYDTKIMEGFSYLGANDSGSSSVALLWIAKVLKNYQALSKLPCDFSLVWFDGEESYLPEWNDGLTRHPAKIQDNTHGSRYYVKNLKACGPHFCQPNTNRRVVGLILLDMIGSPNVQLTRDLNSSQDWLAKAIRLAEEFKWPVYGERKSAVSDDHIPFRNRGIQAIDLIDMNNMQYWHRPGDDPENVSMKSIELVSRLAIALAMEINREQTK
ncbi:MAG: Zn-dependent exopeptidase M28 [Pseudobacteriovorax sp.]|nr:Zn-dependent exopeptidase M28 [Pseudobacteriovorax sp.]